MCQTATERNKNLVRNFSYGSKKQSWRTTLEKFSFQKIPWILFWPERFEPRLSSQGRPWPLVCFSPANSFPWRFLSQSTKRCRQNSSSSNLGWFFCKTSTSTFVFAKTKSGVWQTPGVQAHRRLDFFLHPMLGRPSRLFHSMLFKYNWFKDGNLSQECCPGG